MQPPQKAEGDIHRYDFREDDHDYYSQPGKLFNAMTAEQQQVLCENTARNLGDSTLQIKHRWINHCYQADPAYGEGVAKALEIDLKDVDLNLPQRTSREANYEANNKHPELDKPSKDISKKPPKDCCDMGINTNADPKTLIEPTDDPYLL